MSESTKAFETERRL